MSVSIGLHRAPSVSMGLHRSPSVSIGLHLVSIGLHLVLQGSALVLLEELVTSTFLEMTAFSSRESYQVAPLRSKDNSLSAIDSLR